MRTILYNFCLRTAAGVALMFGLAACGGGGDGGGGPQSATGGSVRSDAGTQETLQVPEARLTAFTIPFWTIFPMTVSKDAEGHDVLKVVKEKPEVYRARKKVRSEFLKMDVWSPSTSYYLGTLENRFGMLCRENQNIKVIPQAEPKDGGQGEFQSDEIVGKYVFVSSDLKEVAYSELFGRVYEDIYNCLDRRRVWGIDANGYSYGFDEFAEDGTALAPFARPRPHDPRFNMTPEQIAQWFSETGIEEIVGAQARTFRAKAFKYTAHGKSIYVFFSMSSPKHPDPSHPESAPEHTKISVSQ